MAPWTTLGIEPTNDIRAIKKAYSIKLKTTRPDDDAAAYQQLREAYEAAQQLAQFMLSEELEEAGEESASPVQDSPPAAPLPVADEEEAFQEVAQGPTVERLLQTCVAILEQGGAAHLVRMWPSLQQQLDDLPIAAQLQANRGFAEFVVQHDVPIEVLIALTRHFLWGLDYRADHQLGLGLSAPLQEKLHQAHVYAAIHGSIAPADFWPLALAKLWTEKRGLWVRFLAICLDPLVRKEALTVPVARLQALGAPLASAKAAVGMASFGGMVQFVMVAMLMLACVVVVSMLGTSYRSWTEITMPAYSMLFFVGIYIYLYRAVEHIDSWGGSLRRWLSTRAWLMDGLVVIPLVVTLVCYLDRSFQWLSGHMADEEVLLSLLIIYSMIWVIVPTEARAWRKLFLPVCLMLGYGLQGFHSTLTDAMVISLAFGWTLVAHVVLSRFGVVFDAVYDSLGELSFLHKMIFLYFGIKLISVLWAILVLLFLPFFLFRMVAQRGLIYAYLAILAGISLDAAVTTSGVQQHVWLPAWVLGGVFAIQFSQAGCQRLANFCLRKLQA